MSKGVMARHVWVVEGRALRRGAKWRVQVPHWSRKEARQRLRLYRHANPRSEFRLRKYVPAEGADNG